MNIMFDFSNLSIEDVCVKKNIGKLFLTNIGLIVIVESYEFDTTLSVVGKLNDDINNYNEMDIMNWLNYEPIDLLYSEFTEQKYGKQIITNKYTYQYAINN